MAPSLRPGPHLRANPNITDAERRCQWEWFRLHQTTAAEAVYLAAQGADPRHPTAGDQLAQLRAGRRPR